jgi:hypothetical protein
MYVCVMGVNSASISTNIRLDFINVSTSHSVIFYALRFIHLISNFGNLNPTSLDLKKIVKTIISVLKKSIHYIRMHFSRCEIEIKNVYQVYDKLTIKS